ncbi:MAG: phosphoribosylanthranilate isomerase [Capsulimonadaceae bacterium]|nr:phosphoribosylanthranilate isomerase [Capsulimonadaceae bacterium]
MPLIKICGISNLKDAIASAENGVDALGFVCDPYSPRYISPETFLQVHRSIPKRVKRVGVFNQNSSPEWSQHGRAAIACFDRLQYGDDSVWPRIIGESWDIRRKIRSFPLGRTADLLAIAGYNGLVHAYLVNVHVQSRAHARDADEFGWQLARQVHQFGKRLYLAGGLSPANVTNAISHVMPYAVDVNVGVEAYPGYKDASKIRDFVQAVRSGVDKTRSLGE